MNIQQEIKALRREFEKIKTKQETREQKKAAFEHAKRGDLTKENSERFKYTDDYYISKIFNGNLKDVIKSQIELEFVTTKTQRDIWWFYRVYGSRLKAIRDDGNFIQTRGRDIKIFVKDKISRKYLGILQLAGDPINMKSRDDLIGWKNRNRLTSVMNLATCISLQPFGYNFNGGKLLASLAFSKEVVEYYKTKYGDPLAAITTTSIYGKSCQYDRLKCLKFIGYTSGYGTSHIPEKLFARGMNLLKALGNYPSFSANEKLRRVKRLLLVLNLPESLVKHENYKGIYFGFTSNQSKSFLCEETLDFQHSCQTVSEVSDWWKNRWAGQRYQYKLSRNEFKTDIELLKPIVSSTERVRKHRENRNVKERREAGKEYMRNYRKNRKTTSDGKKRHILSDGSELREDFADIYLLTNTENGKQYIGKAFHFTGKTKKYIHGYLHRWTEHQRQAKKQLKTKKQSGACVKLNNAINKYTAEKFTLQVLLVCRIEDASAFEIKFIDLYGTYENGYNMTKGGEGISGLQRSEEFCERLRQANLGPNNPNWGKHLTEEHKQKISQANSGENHHFFGTTFSNEYKQKLSDAKKGEKNPNFGKPMKDTHRKNLGKSIKKAKRKITDEQFIEILMKKNTGEWQIEIAEHYNIGRSTISDIWNGKMLPLDETILTDEHLKKINEKTKKQATRKRVLTDDQIREILTFKDGGKTLTEVGNMFTRSDGKKVTKGMVSEIWNGKLTPRFHKN